jgi:transcriptional regulator GlxA family with amidase domain
VTFLSLNPRTLQRKLRLLDLTFSDVLANTRIEIAREYLGSGSLNVTQIAPILGFSEASAVSRFLREAGLSARDLRKPAAKNG